jgi:hypothetical protein
MYYSTKEGENNFKIRKRLSLSVFVFVIIIHP